MWNVSTYELFKAQRARPFADLMARIPARSVGRVVDLGCGTGEPTQCVSDRWPSATVIGVDSSPQMLAAAAVRARPGRLSFESGDVSRWVAPWPVDLIVSNATFHWIPDQAQLLEHVTGQLAPGGTLAVQIPGNAAAPSHRVVQELMDSPRWTQRLAGTVKLDVVHPIPWYVDQLLVRGYVSVDAWETTYVHVLGGPDPVLHWLMGTTLRPILARLDDSHQEEFLGTLAQRLAASYPPGPGGTLFPFRRLFWVARRPQR